MGLEIKNVGKLFAEGNLVSGPIRLENVGNAYQELRRLCRVVAAESDACAKAGELEGISAALMDSMLAVERFLEMTGADDA